MTLVFIDQDKLSVSKTNMRYGRKAPDVSDILPTVRKRGVIQTLLVRPNCQDGHFEIIAGSRRFHAARIVAQETGEAEPLPCRILSDTDDAAAVEASMIENLARLDALGHVVGTVLLGLMRGRPTAALTQRAGGGRPAPRIAQRCLIAA